MNVRWTPQSLKSYFKIIDFLHENWTIKEINNFEKQTDKIIAQIQQNPYMYIATYERKNVRKGFVNKLVSLFYKIYPEKDEIELLLFWNNRQNPKNID